MPAKRETIKFTDPMIRNLEATGKEYWKRGGDGFAVRVSAAGAKRFYYIYTHAGRKRFMPLGVGDYPVVTLAMANTELKKAMAEVAVGNDPLAMAQATDTVQRETPTIKKLVELFIEAAGEDTDKGKRYGYALAHLVKAYGSLKATDLTDDHIETLVEKLAKGGKPSMARKVHATVRVMFKRLKKKVSSHNPCATVDTSKIPSDKTADRRLSDAEVHTFWHGLDSMALTLPVQLALKLILVTAQRPGEVAAIHTSEINGNWWTLPKERAKNGREHRIFLTPLAKDLIAQATAYAIRARELPDDKPYAGHIFPTPHLTKDKPITRHSLSKGLARVRREDGQLLDGLAPFHPHDLRRSAATLMATSGVLREYRERVLNHALEELDETYNQHDYDLEKQKALESLERKIRSLINPSRLDNVVGIDTARVGAA